MANGKQDNALDPEGAEFQNAVSEEFRNAQPFITKHTDPPRESMPLQSPDHDDVLKKFKYDHLPPHLQDISRPFATLADQLYVKLPRNRELLKALDHLLYAKDAAVRAALP